MYKLSKFNLLFIVPLFFLAACAKKTFTTPSLATLKPIARIMVTDKSSFPDAPRYSMTLYSDQRLEFTGFAGIDKIGQYTTMLSAKEKENFIQLIAAFKRGHFTVLEDQKKLWYDVIYYPLKKEISMGDAVQEALQTERMSAFLGKTEDFVTYKNWLKKTEAPNFVSGKDAGNMLVTLKQGTSPNEVVKSEKYKEWKFKAVMPSDKMSNTWLFTFAEGNSTADAVYKIKSHPNVLGAIPNALIDIDGNMKSFENQQLIVQFKEKVNIDEWIKTYEMYEMKVVEKVAPDLSYWVVAFNSSTIFAKDLIAKIKQDGKVKEAQLNRRVSVRE
jgi:hypothetical protein